MNYRSSYFIITCIAFGFAFLYVPILSMVVFSFNASKLGFGEFPHVKMVLLAFAQR
jgi:ABC-type spermidine/putrescine transport system permease subunit II